MLQTLNRDFLDHYGLTGSRYSVHSRQVLGDLFLHDDKACCQCKRSNRQQCSAEDDEQVLHLFTSSNITIVDIEDYVLQFHGRRAGQGMICDLLLFDDSNTKIAFLDFYCGVQSYLYDHSVDGSIEAGKIAKVRRQISDTVGKLYTVPSIKSRIDAFSEKIGIFAYRRKMYGTNNPIEDNMTEFERPSIVTSQNFFSELPYGFKFLEVDYPQVYQW